MYVIDSNGTASAVIYDRGKKSEAEINMGQADKLLFIGKRAIKHAGVALDQISQQEHDKNAVRLVRQALAEQQKSL